MRIKLIVTHSLCPHNILSTPLFLSQERPEPRTQDLLSRNFFYDHLSPAFLSLENPLAQETRVTEGESSREGSTASVMASDKGCQKISLQKAVSSWGIPREMKTS